MGPFWGLNTDIDICRGESPQRGHGSIPLPLSMTNTSKFTLSQTFYSTKMSKVVQCRYIQPTNKTNNFRVICVLQDKKLNSMRKDIYFCGRILIC